MLGLDLFEGLREEMGLVESVQGFLNQGIGWHYLLDLAWMVRQTRGLARGSLVLDAGAGGGLSQFILSELGFNVISLDFTARDFSKKPRYGRVTHYLNDQGVAFDNRYTRHLAATYGIGVKKGLAGLGRLVRALTGQALAGTPAQAAEIIGRERLRPGPGGTEPMKGDPEKACGRIFLYRADLKDMGLIADGSVDAVVSISALEHNDHDDLKRCVRELLRVTRPGGRLSVTVSASPAEDFFHEPSKGWCYGEASLKELFGLAPEAQSNFALKESIYAQLRLQGNELHKRLAPFYFKSGDNGMPWGKWDPRYMPVGVTKKRC